jgi:hypothetical protein
LRSLAHPSCYDTTTWLAQTVQTLQFHHVGSGMHKTCSLLYVNSPNIAIPYVSRSHGDAIVSFLKYLDTNRPCNTPDSAEAVIMCENGKCNNLGFWQLQATIPSYLNRHSCTTLSLCTHWADVVFCDFGNFLCYVLHNSVPINL